MTAPASEDAQRLAERSVAAMLERDAYSAWLGLEVTEVLPGGCTVTMTVRDDMLNGFGVCHGGITFALADSALAFASNTSGWITMSVENAISYPMPVRAGDELIARAEEEAGASRIAFYRVTVRRGTDTVAIFRGTVYRTNRPLHADVVDGDPSNKAAPS